MSKRDTVLWLTGWSVPSRIWEPFAACFPDHRHEMPELLSAETAEDMCDQAARAVENAPGPVRIVGWSMGAMLGLELADRFPERVKLLCLAGAAASFVRRQKGEPGWDPRVLRRMIARLGKEPEAVLEEFDRRMFTEEETEQGHLARWREHVRCDSARPATLAEGLRFLEAFVLEQPQRLTMPVHLLAGGLDVICPPEGAGRLAAALPQARLTVWEKAGHAPLWTDPWRFIRWLKEAMIHGD